MRSLNFSPYVRFLRFGFSLVIFFAFSSVFAQSSESALKMVKTFRLGQNLGGMVYQIGKTTVTYRGVENALGSQKADELLKAEILLTLPKYQEQWNENLAQAWTPLMTAEEFDSVIAEKQKSPFAAKFMSLQDKAGLAMKAKSEPLLQAVLTEVLNSVLAKSIPKK